MRCVSDDEQQQQAGAQDAGARDGFGGMADAARAGAVPLRAP